MARTRPRRADKTRAAVLKRRRLLLAELGAAVGVSTDDERTDADLLLAVHAAPGLARHRDHDRAAAWLLTKLIPVLQRQRTELHELLERRMPRDSRSYATIRDAVAALYPAGSASWSELMAARPAPSRSRRRADEQRIRTTGTFVDALLRDLDEQLVVKIAQCEDLACISRFSDGARSGPLADDSRRAAAREIHASFVRRGHPAAWLATVAVLERAGWKLGPGSARAKAERLRKADERAP